MASQGVSAVRGVIEGVTIPGINDQPASSSKDAARQTKEDPGRGTRARSSAPRDAVAPVQVLLPDRDLIQAARLQARHRQANRAQSVANQDSIPGYTIKRELHRGGQGVVYLGVCDATAKQVAIKIIRDGSLASETQRDRFEREIHVLAQLRHPNIVSVIDSGRVDGSGYLVMDYIDGCELGTHVERAGLSIDDVLRLMVKVCEAVKAAHVRGVIHRDLKPGNIMVDARGEPHVLDFGLAKLRGEESDPGEALTGSINTRTGQFLGSLPFASPEQARGEVSKVDVRTDVYALGVILYRILTGKFPYPVEGSIAEVAVHIDRTEPERASKFRSDISNQLDIILLRALAKSRSRRYQSVSELAADIERLLMRETIDAKRDSTMYVLSQLAVRHRVVSGALIAGVVTLGLASAFFGVRLADRTAHLRQVEAERDALRLELDRTQSGPSLVESDPITGDLADRAQSAQRTNTPVP